MGIDIFMVIAQAAARHTGGRNGVRRGYLGRTGRHSRVPSHGRNGCILFSKRIVCIHSPALAHRHVMRRIKAGRSDITDGTGKMLTRRSMLIAASEGITVVLNQPQVMTVTEFFYLL